MAGAKSGGREAHLPRSGLRVGLLEERRQSSGKIGNGEVPETEEGAKTAALRRASQRRLESMRVVGRKMWQRGSAASSERTRKNSVGTKASVNWQRESRGIPNDGVAEGKESGGTAGTRRG